MGILDEMDLRLKHVEKEVILSPELDPSSVEKRKADLRTTSQRSLSQATPSAGWFALVNLYWLTGSLAGGSARLVELHQLVNRPSS